MSADTPKTGSIKVFLSYAHEDEDLRGRLEKHLAGLRREGVIDIWHDRRIGPGSEWARDLDQNLDTANVVLLLISPDFMNSDYCYGVEMTRALELHKRGAAVVIPILLRPVHFDGAPFSDLQMLPSNGIAVTAREWHDPDEALRDVAAGVHRTVSRIAVTHQTSTIDVQATPGGDEGSMGSMRRWRRMYASAGRRLRWLAVVIAVAPILLAITATVLAPVLEPGSAIAAALLFTVLAVAACWLVISPGPKALLADPLNWGTVLLAATAGAMSFVVLQRSLMASAIVVAGVFGAQLGVLILLSRNRR